MEILPEVFPCPIISKWVFMVDHLWLWQPLSVPSTWTWDVTSSYGQVESQYPAAMEADAFPFFMGLLHSDSSWSLSVTLDTFSHYLQARRLAHSNSAEAPQRGPLAGPPSEQGSGFNQWDNLPPLNPELLPPSLSLTQEVKAQPQDSTTPCLKARPVILTL